MANEDVSRIMQSKPELRYSPAFVHIKALSRLAMFACRAVHLPHSIRRHFGRVPACVLKLYNARTPDVVSQLGPHHAVNYVYLEQPLHRNLSGPLRRYATQFRALSCAPGAIFRPALTTRVARDLSRTDVCRANNE